MEQKQFPTLQLASAGGKEAVNCLPSGNALISCKLSTSVLCTFILTYVYYSRHAYLCM